MSDLVHFDLSVLLRFEQKFIPEPNSGCWLWTAAVARGGYGAFRLGDHMCVASRVSWQLYRGPIPEGIEVLHRCDNPPCVNPDHLFLGTQLDNVLDAKAKGHLEDRRGELHHNSKITEEQARAILVDRRPLKVIAEEFRISRGTVANIRCGQAWPHLDRRGAS